MFGKMLSLALPCWRCGLTLTGLRQRPECVCRLTAWLSRLSGGNLVVWIHLAANRNRPCGLPTGCGFALLCFVVLVRRFGAGMIYTNHQ